MLLHAVIEEARQQHIAQPLLQFVGVEVRIPRAHRALLVIEDADQAGGERAQIRQAGVGFGSRLSAGWHQLYIGKIGRLARARRRVGHMQAGLWIHARIHLVAWN